MDAAQKTYNVAVVGAEDLVGEAILSLLVERKFPVNRIYALGGEDLVGESAEFGRRELGIESLANFDFTKTDLVFFAADTATSAQYAKCAAEQGCIVIDTTDQFRLSESVPLIVPEANIEQLSNFKSGIIAIPSAIVTQVVLALKPLHDVAKVQRVNVATYQAVSSSGKKAVEDLARQTVTLLNARPIEHSVYPKQMAFNVLPAYNDVLENGYTQQEMMLALEMRKVFLEPELVINPTIVTVPVFFGHSCALHVELAVKLSAKEARALLIAAPGIQVLDEPQEAGGCPTPVTEAAGNDPVYIGRIREDISHLTGLALWVTTDNIRKGAALNAIQIAEYLLLSAEV